MDRQMHVEDFIKIINQAKKDEEEYEISKNKDIKKGFIVVSYEKYEFIEKEVIKDRLKMFMPKEFELMDEQDIASKYPDEDKPDIIYTNEGTDINVTFTIDDGEALNSDIKQITTLLKYQMERIYSGSNFEKEEFIQRKDGRVIGYIGFNLAVVDGEIYTKMFFLELQGNLLIGTISYDIRDKNEWDKIVGQMIESIEVL